MLTARNFLPSTTPVMSDKIKVLITASSTNVAGRFADRGDIIEVPPQVAQDLFNEGHATANPAAIAAREAAVAAPVAEHASAAPRIERKARARASE